MSQEEKVVLFVNEAVAGGQAGDLEKNVGNLDGVLAVEVGHPDQHGMGPSPSLVKKVTISYDPTVTNPQDLRVELEDTGYAVTALGELGE